MRLQRRKKETAILRYRRELDGIHAFHSAGRQPPFLPDQADLFLRHRHPSPGESFATGSLRVTGDTPGFRSRVVIYAHTNHALLTPDSLHKSIAETQQGCEPEAANILFQCAYLAGRTARPEIPGTRMRVGSGAVPLPREEFLRLLELDGMEDERGIRRVTVLDESLDLASPSQTRATLIACFGSEKLLDRYESITGSVTFTHPFALDHIGWGRTLEFCSSRHISPRSCVGGPATYIREYD